MSKNNFFSKRAPIYKDIPDEKWNDWRWQLSHRLNSTADFNGVINLTESEKRALDASELFRVDITPYFASLIDPDDPQDPIRRQVIPMDAEVSTFTGMMEDSLAEDAHSPVPGLVHRYPDRALMLVTAQIEYLQRTPQIRDVLLSGGDPLVLAPKVLKKILMRLREIPHLEIVRIGSRVPVFMPMRVTDELCDMLREFHPLWLNIHVNHPNEITQELADACGKLADAGIPLGNQSVLLAGINDCVHIQRKLVQKLVRMRVRPYYLYICDLVEGAGHFRTPVSKGVEIIEGLRGHTSGFAVPTFVVDAPGGGGKIPVEPNYIISSSDHKVVLRNYEGFISTYEEPQDYQAHDVKTCKYCQGKRQEEGQAGVFGLLDGESMVIKPEGFDRLHIREGDSHRLRADEGKWKALGIGDGETGKE